MLGFGLLLERLWAIQLDFPSLTVSMGFVILVCGVTGLTATIRVPRHTQTPSLQTNDRVCDKWPMPVFAQPDLRFGSAHLCRCVSDLECLVATRTDAGADLDDAGQCHLAEREVS